ncbi:tRNA (cytosine(34)-C(5))-methyltransferase [Bertholletia excelsa]
MFPSGKSYLDGTDTDHDIVLGEGHDNGGKESSDNELKPNKDPKTLTDVLEEEVSTLPLERCMRMVPHDQNTGAFFIAVFRKVSPLPVVQKKSCSHHRHLGFSQDPQPEKLVNEVKEDVGEGKINSAGVTTGQLPKTAPDADMQGNEQEETVLDADIGKQNEENENDKIQTPVDKEIDPEVVGGKRKLQIQGKWRGVDPVVFFTNEAVVDSVKTFYGIDESFAFDGHLVTRNSDANHVKRIYYISESVKDILELNLKGGQQLKITSVGLKMFERQSSKEGSLSPCAFRISSEGLPLILPHITKQILYAFPVDFKHLLQYKTIKFADFVDAEFGEKASKLMLGCCVVVLLRDGQSSSNPPPVDASTVAIGCWRGRTNVSVMVTAIDCQEMLERLSMRAETESVSVQLEMEHSSVVPDEPKTNDIETKGDGVTTESTCID